MSSSFEPGKVGWDRFFDMIVGLIDTTTEAIIAEIIDNSIDHNSEEIKVVLGGNDFTDFHVIVYDKGVGFESKEHLKNAFNLAIKYFDKHGKIGKNQVGMKLSPLSNCCTVTVFSKPNDELLHRTIDRNLIAKKGQYGTTENVPEGDIYQKVPIDLEKGKWTTAVLLSNFDTEPFSGDFEKTLPKYCTHLSDFIGMVYEPLLLGYAKHRCTPDITIECNDVTYEVVPKDPFWKDFTPDRISERLKLPKSRISSFKDEDKELMQCLIEFGTIATKTREVEINLGDDFDNEKEMIEITSYAIPRGVVRSKIPGIYTLNEIATGPSSTGSESLKSEKMSGFYFYRNGRCICFGDTGSKSKSGWYGWKGTLVHKWVRVRFEVKFPESMDRYMKLSPTKDKVNPSSHFFKQILPQVGQVIKQPLVRGGIGNMSLPFYQPQPDEADSVAGFDSLTKYGAMDDCDYCGHVHFNQEKCKSKPCKECGIPGCPPEDCKYDCPLCPEIGHHERNCPTNCQYCEYPKGSGGHKGKPCPLLCELCGQINCQGPCNKGCNKCDCECLCPDCGKKGLPCSCKAIELDSPFTSGDEMIITINRNSKDESIAFIKQAVEFLGLNLDDLE